MGQAAPAGHECRTPQLVDDGGPPSARPLVAVVEDHLLLADTLCHALVDHGVAAIVVSVLEPGDLLERLTALPADLILLDLDLGPWGDGGRLVAPLVRAGRKVLVVTGNPDPMRVAVALEDGAIGYQAKCAGFDQVLRKTVRALQASGPLDPARRTALLCELARTRARRDEELAPFTRLTEREHEVLVALGHGVTAQQMATSWVVTEATVRTHIRGVLTKIGVRSQLEAVAAALRVGVISPVRTPS